MKEHFEIINENWYVFYPLILAFLLYAIATIGKLFEHENRK